MERNAANNADRRTKSTSLGRRGRKAGRASWTGGSGGEGELSTRGNGFVSMNKETIILVGDYSSSMQNPGASVEAFLTGRASKGKKKCRAIAASGGGREWRW